MINLILNLIFPPKCIFCKDIMKLTCKTEICEKCYSKIPFILEPKIIFKSKYCDGFIACCKYKGIIKRAIKDYKYYNKSSYYRSLATVINRTLENMTNELKFDIIIGVPLHNKKLIQRGYNQSELIANHLSKLTGVLHKSNLIKRIRYTNSQSFLNKAERYVNIKDAFSITNSEEIEGKNILLVDDILTTGNTLNECSKTLKEFGANKVYAVVVATGKS